MIISLQDIPKEGLSLSYLESSEKFGFPRSSFPDPISISLYLSRDGDEILAEGRVVARELLQCSRCLAEATNLIEAQFMTAYAPLTQAPREEEVQLRREDLDVIFYQDDSIELSELITGQILLARPMRPLCKPECLGLCQACGQDLNLRACGCSPEVYHSPFSALIQVKRALEDR